MSEPYFIPDKKMFSICCGFISLTEIVDNTAICSSCKEHAYFESEDDYYEDDYYEDD